MELQRPHQQRDRRDQHVCQGPDRYMHDDTLDARIDRRPGAERHRQESQ